MPYDWSALVFVEKWRTHASRGVLLGSKRAGDQTHFGMRLQASEWGSSNPGSYADIELLDAGDIIREKRIALLDRVAALVHLTALTVEKTDRKEKSLALTPLARSPRLLNARGRLTFGSIVSGEVQENDGERYLLIDVGFQTVVAVLDKAELADIKPGDWIEFTLQMPAKGFITAS